MSFLDLVRNYPDFPKIALKSGERLFREGDAGDAMYVLLAGEAGVSVGGLSVEVCKAGDILGEVALIDDSPRSATVTASTDCELAVVDKQRFHFLAENRAGFAIEVMRTMARRLKQADYRLSGTAVGYS